MKHAVFVGRDKDQFAPIVQMLTQKNITIELAGSGDDLLTLLSNTAPGSLVDLVVIGGDLPPDLTKDLVEAVTVKSPFSHCVVTGDMAHKDFHDFYEGYGVLMQISDPPAKEDAERLEAHLNKLAGLGRTTP